MSEPTKPGLAETMYKTAHAPLKVQRGVLASADSIITAFNEVEKEFNEAFIKYPSFNSPHEAYAVLLEEVDELWDEVKVQTKDHDRMKMRKEAMQIAAMALRFMVDLT